MINTRTFAALMTLALAATVGACGQQSPTTQQATEKAKAEEDGYKVGTETVVVLTQPQAPTST